LIHPPPPPPRPPVAAAGQDSRRFGRLSALRARTKPPCKNRFAVENAEENPPAPSPPPPGGAGRGGAGRGGPNGPSTCPRRFSIASVKSSAGRSGARGALRGRSTQRSERARGAARSAPAAALLFILSLAVSPTELRPPCVALPQPRHASPNQLRGQHGGVHGAGGAGCRAGERAQRGRCASVLAF
jgi:hypothetical protein